MKCHDHPQDLAQGLVADHEEELVSIHAHFKITMIFY